MAHHTTIRQDESLSQLRVARRIAPTQNGAKRFALRYGHELVCVRHRLNAAGTTRYTTIELLVETTPVVRAGTRMVALRLGPGEKSTRSLLMACGAQWDKTQKLWFVARQVAKTLGLTDRIVQVTG